MAAYGSDDEAVQCSPYAKVPTTSLSGKVVNDYVHGHMELDRYILDFVDTVQFQRLRDLKQLGACFLVFPGASHTRFEHSLGVSHLAGKMARRLWSVDDHARESCGREVTERDLELIQIAALCHDIGHGPFSHVFDNEFMRLARPELKFTHEQASGMLIENLIDQNALEYDTDEVSFLKDLIDSDRRPNQNGWIYEIVSNSRNSIDVDKFDYLQRDCYNIGVKSTYDASRLMKFCRVINDEICFHSKEVYNVYELFHTRYSLFKTVYTHRAAKAIEYMICDALLNADQTLRISDSVADPEMYTLMTDSILPTIERSRDPALAESRRIIRNIRQRKLYRFVDEFILPPQSLDNDKLRDVQPVDISTFQDGSGTQLSPDDIIVHNCKINYAMKDKNPVDHVHFFSDWEDDTSFSIPKHKVSALIPEQFQERIIRVFTRDPSKSAAVQRAFARFLRNRQVSSPRESERKALELRLAEEHRSSMLNQREKRMNPLMLPPDQFKRPRSERE